MDTITQTTSILSPNPTNLRFEIKHIYPNETNPIIGISEEEFVNNRWLVISPLPDSTPEQKTNFSATINSFISSKPAIYFRGQVTEFRLELIGFNKEGEAYCGLTTQYYIPSEKQIKLDKKIGVPMLKIEGDIYIPKYQGVSQTALNIFNSEKYFQTQMIIEAIFTIDGRWGFWAWPKLK